MSEYSGRTAAFLRMVFLLFVARTPVTECGYMNNAMAEPRASVQYAE